MSLMKTTTNRGFTLTELLVVISIIAVLSSIVLVGVNQARNRGKNARAAADISQYITGLALVRERQGEYPSTGGVNAYMCLGTSCQWGGSAVSNAGSGVVGPDWLGGVMSSIPSSSNLQSGYQGYQYASNGSGYTLRWFLYGQNRDCDPGEPISGSVTGITRCEYSR